MKPAWKILCVLACVVIGLSVTFPYFSASVLGLTVSWSLTDSNYWICVLIVAGVALVLAVLDHYETTICLGFASLGLFFQHNSLLNTNLGSEIDALARSLIQKGYGYYFLMVGSIALIGFSVMGLVEEKRN